ncbi:short-subunit dehydrogenase [Dyadobacter jejuensis]|uniref:Short-subunit dehydrogenase n=1 Tax=Dyadobacter jejuensis TaxID=1082580 RepID=A0A316AR60_9BACT|nr:SDR family oxidoreductase [Dyadobacter jejuensis]PWJ59866.1 short-subunit dehydrogenase [Dyadobacter jejuensis]
MNPLLVVTGGTKGIGKAIISKFMAEKYDVITCARNEADLVKLQKEMSLTYPDQSLETFTADLSDAAETQEFLQFIKKKNRNIEVLINNTGVFMPGQIHNEAEGVLEKTIETNVYSAYRMTRGLVADMIKVRKGHIFNICSTASIMAYPNGGSYCISKFALLGMTKVLREEMKAFDVKVTAILPGATYTDSWQGTDLPEERFISSKDIAETIWSAKSLSNSALIEEILIRPQLGDLD